jgi:hypothetical protein
MKYSGSFFPAALLLALHAKAQFLSAPSTPSTSTVVTLDTGGLTSALDRNVQAISNLTASNERTVGTLRDMVGTLTASNDRNVASIANVTEKMLPSLHALSTSTQDMMKTWDESIKPSVDSLGSSVDNMVHTWDQSIKSSVDSLGSSVDNMVRTWDQSIKPSVDSLGASANDMVRTWDQSIKPSVDSLGASANDMVRTWDQSIRPSVDGMTRVAKDAVSGIGNVSRVGEDALKKWDDSVKPTVNDALKMWDGSMAPRVDNALALGKSALSSIDSTLLFGKNTLFPVVMITVTVWVAMCSSAAVVCCLIKSRRDIEAYQAVALSDVDSKSEFPRRCMAINPLPRQQGRAGFQSWA